MTAPIDYMRFLEAKVSIAPVNLLTCDPSEVNPKLKPHQRDQVVACVAGGYGALFNAFGLGKTNMQLEIVRLAMLKHGSRRGLIVLPLGVPQEFKRDAVALGLTVKFVKSTAEVTTDGIYLTNYESVRDAKIDPTLFDVVSLDEASCLRSFGSETFGEMLFGPIQEVPYRFVATATPSPNQYLELISYAHFLGVMDMGEAKTRFFKRNSEKADSLTLHPHKEEEFWMWVASWAIFLQKPSDLGYSDEGYELPPLEIHWHEVPSDHSDVEPTAVGQGRMFKDTALGVTSASREKRDSIDGRMAKLLELREIDPAAHRLLWHDLEAERFAIEKAIPTAVSVYGNQKDDEKELAIVDFTNGKIQELAAKPSMLGSGPNFQYHCSWAIFLGIGFKFNDFIQAIHRIYRFLQKAPSVRVDFIYTEAERGVKDNLVRKWRQHDEMVAKLSEIIRKYGLSRSSLVEPLKKSIGVERRQECGKNWLLVNNDSVLEAQKMRTNSVGLILTSIPFSTQYEYTPSYNDFGATDSQEHFFEQMDYLTPEMLRILKPGRNCVIHVKDRVVPGAITGLGFQSIEPFHANVLAHMKKHGFVYLGMKTIVTDVVRENAQTYRLGWSEMCKDSSRMGCGMPEYLMIFRKPPTDSSSGYGDCRIEKSKEEYSRARWQVDAHGFMRSNGNRLLMPEDMLGLDMKHIFRAFRKHSLETVYDFEHDVAIAEYITTHKRLPTDFMLLQPQSWHNEVWTDIFRAGTLNNRQAAKNRVKHLCPLQFDIVRRSIIEYSSKGDVVWDPFSGLGTVALEAIKLGRIGLGCELNPDYWQDSCHYLKQEGNKAVNLSLFDIAEIGEDEDQDLPRELAS